MICTFRRIIETLSLNFSLVLRWCPVFTFSRFNSWLSDYLLYEPLYLTLQTHSWVHSVTASQSETHQCWRKCPGQWREWQISWSIIAGMSCIDVCWCWFALASLYLVRVDLVPQSNKFFTVEFAGDWCLFEMQHQGGKLKKLLQKVINVQWNSRMSNKSRQFRNRIHPSGPPCCGRHRWRSRRTSSLLKASKSQASILNRQYTEKTSSDLSLWFDSSAKKNQSRQILILQTF